MPIDVLRVSARLTLSFCCMHAVAQQFAAIPGFMSVAGIAYDNVNKRLFITGKCWPKMYEVKTQITKLQMSPTQHLQVQQMCGVTL